MAFTIYNATSFTPYNDDHVMDVKDSAVIEVRTSAGEQVALYSPCFWTKVEPGMKQAHNSPPLRDDVGNRLNP